jgi:hypothetical protein
MGFSITAQSFDTGTMGIEVSDVGRIRVHKPAIGTRQIDRSSILVGVSETAVFDYTNDADNEAPMNNVLTPLWSDFQIYGAVNNNFSNNPPDVVVDMNVYGWNNGAYALAHFVVKNLEAAPITAIIGIEILPQIENAYGDETCAYNGTNGVAYFYKTTYAGYKLLSAPLKSVKFETWASGYAVDNTLWSWLNHSGFDNNYLPGADGAVAVMAQEPVTLNPNETIDVYYAVAVGDNENDLYANIAAAEQQYNLIVPVELTSFTASATGSEVTLNWTTATEVNNMGFEIERKMTNDNETAGWQVIGFKEGMGTTSEITTYNYSDDVSLLNADKLTYRLRQIDYNGNFEYSEEIEVEIKPLTFSLEQNYPNPFNPSTIIRFGIPSPSHVKLAVYNSIGEEVAVLKNEMLEAGSYDINFDASRLSAGVYFYSLKTDSYHSTKKMILIK